MTDLAFWVAVYVSLTVGCAAGMFIVAALHDCHRDQPDRRQYYRNVRVVTPNGSLTNGRSSLSGSEHRPYDWADPQ